jgi:ABC-type transport system involved in multi-copper enzyme maturation permease subunit
MNPSWIAQLGNWNPQLLREFRGRLKQRSLIAAIALSIIFQGLILLLLFNGGDSPRTSDFLKLWKGFTGVFTYALLTIGSFYLVSNLAQEEKSGTLNFIRLSPRPAWQILVGKLFGVPVLPLIAIGLVFPLHFITAILGRVPILLAISYYIILAAGCLLCWSLAMLFGFIGSNRAGLAGQATTLSISYAALTFIVLAPLFSFWNTAITWRPLDNGFNIFGPPAPEILWMWTPLNSNPLISHGFTLANIGILLFVSWRIMLRRFRRPRTTFLSRRQSYGIMAYVLVLALGFFLIPDFFDAPPAEPWQQNNMSYFLENTGLGLLAFVTYLLGLFLMGSICPQRQALMDWSRQPQQGIAGLIWSDKSPAIVSFGILLIIANFILIPFLLLLPFGDVVKGFTPFARLIMLFGLSTTLMLIGSFMQYLFTLNLRNPSIWFVGSLLLWWILPPLVLGIMGSWFESYTATTTIWAFFGYPVAHFFSHRNLPFVILGIVLQWGAIAFLLLRLQQSLYQFRHLDPKRVSES